MITRIVELEIEPLEMESAKVLLNEVAPKVRAQNGCSHLEILIDVHNTSRVTTYSRWDAESDLNAYRDSAVFINFWKAIKPKFKTKARAWTSATLVYLPKD